MKVSKYIATCPNCHQRIMPEEQGDDFEPFPFFREGDSLPRWVYVFAQCEICWQTLVIRRRIEGEERKTLIVEILWPAPERTLSDVVPESLRREHSEARACFNAKAYTATVVMVRRTLEGVCSDHGVTKKPLYAALEEMRSNGLIEGRLLEWAQELRVLGNDAAHFTGRPVSSQDAEDALSLAEALMDYMYVFSAQFGKFRARRAGQLPNETDMGDS